MALISLKEISLAFGGPLVFDQLTLNIEPGERIALLGRNGEGKTTLMKVIAREQSVSCGEVIHQKGIQVAFLQQEVPLDIRGPVFEVVLSGLGSRAKLLGEYHALTQNLEQNPSPETLRKLDLLQSELDHTGSWDIKNKIDHIITRMKLDPSDLFENLSGGQKRRVLLARALVIQPELLMLDEPTNHLDIDSIAWLEEFLKDYPGTVFFITHDRLFMTHLATRIIELDRGKIYSWACDYKTFLERKQASLEIEAIRWEKFDKKLAKEEVWIRQGIKARRCRNEGRVKDLLKLREEKKEQRKQMGVVRMTQQNAPLPGHLVIKVSHVEQAYGDKCLIRDFSTQIMRGDKIGVIGPNGCGKTTLLKILLEKLSPGKGSVRLGTNLQIAYYDQMREQLNEEKTVAENVGGDSDTVMINGKSRHIMGYLQDFLFSPERARTPVKVLSGGERNRLLLARLFTRPFNLLVMDEPTNDLDIETLELLEELLLEYKGTLILVSHDRAFLNNVVTSTLAIEKDGWIGEYAGGYDDWLYQRRIFEETKPVEKPKTEKQKMPERKSSAQRKLTFKEKKELEEITQKIEKMEAEQKDICTLLSDEDFYRRDPREIAATNARLKELGEELPKAYERWEFLSEIGE